MNSIVILYSNAAMEFNFIHNYTDKKLFFKDYRIC